MLTIKDMRAKASAFVNEWEGETREDAERQSFWNDWFEIFGIKRRGFVSYERNVKKLKGTTGKIDAFWPGNLLVEHKSAGEDLDKAMDQAEEYLIGLPEEEMPRLIVLSDFARFRILNLETNEEIEFPLKELPENVELFTFLAGYRARWFEEQDEVNVKAAALMGQIYDRLAENGYDGEQLNLLLVRLVFLMFADDTGLWGETGLFEDYIERKTDEDGSDLGPRLGQLFELLDTPVEKRQAATEESLKPFPYVNGHLFSDQLPLAAFDNETREQVLLACRFNWSKISPAIFGSMFQSVMDPEARRSLGAHYTTEQNIMKTIQPLFLDELHGQLAAAGEDRNKLKSLLADLRKLTFFDPACGSGNFLVIAYRELRRIELEVLRRLHRLDNKVRTGQLTTDAMQLSEVDVDQFYGIEIEEFPARIAEVAMYLMDHLANQELSQEFGLPYSRLPLHSPAHIRIGNALRIDWNDVLPASECTYLFGNPPFVGMSMLDKEQQADNRLVFEELADKTGVDLKGRRTGRLDYVACWYAKALAYMTSTSIRAAFVSTNSITQGDQARTMGPLIADSGFDITFAWPTFSWTSEARGKAAVHVVIIGFASSDEKVKKQILSLDSDGGWMSEKAKSINIYLTDSSVQAIGKHRKPLRNVPKLTEGNKPQDGGGLIVEDDERAAIEASDPIAAEYLRRLIGARDMLHAEPRWCFWLVDAPSKDIKESPELTARMKQVAEARLASPTASAREKAQTPGLFLAIRQPTSRWLCVPSVSSENRPIIPMAFFEPEDIAHNSILALDGADEYLFGILQSKMFTVWAKTVSGRLKSDVRMAPDLSYNSFPFPDDGANRDAIEAAARSVLETREAHPDESLHDLYGTDVPFMPADLVEAHKTLDRAVDKAMRPKSFADDGERLSFLFKRYEKLAQSEGPAPLPTP